MVEYQHTLKDVYKIAGKDLTDKMLAVATKKDNLVKWFYKPNKFLKNKSPYEICREGKQSELEKAIMDVLTAAQGG